MFDIIKQLWSQIKTFKETNYKRLKNSFGLHQKQFDRFWWQYVSDNGIVDINK